MIESRERSENKEETQKSSGIKNKTLLYTNIGHKTWPLAGPRREVLRSIM